MIRYHNTRLGGAYQQYTKEYLRGLVEGNLETLELLDTSLLGINRSKGSLPKINIPYVVPANHEINTHSKTIVLADTSGVRGSEADLRYINAILTAGWEDPLIDEKYYSVRKFATKAYMNWISRSMKNRFNLSFEDASEMSILAAVYYFCAHSNIGEILDPKNFKAYADLAEITNLGAIRVKAVIDRYSLTTINSEFTLASMVDCMSRISNDTKNKISVETLMSTLAHSWYGEGGVFYCNLALEYPPMFLTLLYFSLVDKGYTKTRLGTLVSEFAVGRNTSMGDMYAKQINTIVKSFKVRSA